MYSSMQTQLDTTLIHMATSERPIYTSLSSLESAGAAPEWTTFLFHSQDGELSV